MTCNVAAYLPLAADRHPDQHALIYRRGGRWQTLSFRDLDALSDSYAHGLTRQGLQPGARVLLMVRSGPEFVALTFALFKMGALPSLIDPGMGMRGVLSCVRQLQPDALIGIPAAHVVRMAARSSFASVRLAVSVGGPGAMCLSQIADTRAGRFPIHATQPEDEAAILFTSGSTGPAKGVVYRHGIFTSQVDALRAMYGFEPGEIDMPAFPLFALFSTALGMTCLIPEVNPSRPATADPAKLVATIQDWRVHSAQGSPAVWRKVGTWCRQRGIKLPTLKRVITFGAPVPVEVIRDWQDILPDGAEIHTPYGATEALPVSTIGGRTILAETSEAAAAGAGTCVGRPAPGVEVRIIPIEDGPVAHCETLPAGQIGEVAVSGEMVTHRYHALPEADRLSKIVEGGRVWHRMGDVGYFDTGGRLWFCGRKAHRIESPGGKTYFSVNGEGIADTHPDVFRSALVGVRGEPVLVVERWPHRARGRRGKARLTADLLARLSQHPLYGDVRTVLYHAGFPVDPRHNAKIHREDLAAWAAAQMR
ncbi:MAG: fatty acid CoA ligase family protein [Candidatus Xenobia bacterium]